MLTRREILKTFELGAVAAAVRPALADAGKPVFRIGFLTDTHVGPREASCRLVAGAMKIFREHKCGAIVHCGDLADLHYNEGYKFYRAEEEKAFPPGMPNRPDFLYVHANHDIIDPVKARDPKQAANRFMDYGEAFRDMDMRLHDAVQPDFVQREYGGLPLLVFPQEMSLVGGYKAFEAKIAAAEKAYPEGPVLVCTHLPAEGTTYNSGQWGNSAIRDVFNRHPRIVAFTGHVHNSLRNELCIWHGENSFTAVDVGCLQVWEGVTIGTPVRSKRAYEAIVTEIYADRTLVIRRFDVRDGAEIKPLAAWTVPLNRAKESPGAFAPGAKVTCVTDAVPYKTVTLRFPAVTNGDDVIHYRLEAFDGNGQRAARCDVYGEFYKGPAERTGQLEGTFSNAFFDGGDYRLTVTPIGFFGTRGRPLEVRWTPPAKTPARLVWQSAKPMEELKFRAGWTHDAKSAAKAVDVPVKDGFATWNRPTWAVLPEDLWNRPKGTKLRFTADLTMEQDPKGEGWTLYLRAMDGTQRCATSWITAAPEEKGVFRAVFEFELRESGVPYHFGVMKGNRGRFAIHSLKLEELPEAK